MVNTVVSNFQQNDVLLDLKTVIRQVQLHVQWFMSIMYKEMDLSLLHVTVHEYHIIYTAQASM